MNVEKKIDENIDYDNYTLTKTEQNRYYAVSLTAIFSMGYLFYQNLILAALLLAAVIPLKRFYTALKIKKRRERLRYQFKDLLYSLSASVSSGRHMMEALKESETNLKFMYSEEEPIMKELAHMVKNMEESRISEELLLKDFAYRSGIEEIIAFSDIYSTCRTTGADLSSMITRAAEILTEKMSIEREITTITSQKKAEAKIISAMPVIILLFLNFSSPSYLDSLYHTFAGNIIMTAALCLMVISYIVINKMVEVKI